MLPTFKFRTKRTGLVWIVTEPMATRMRVQEKHLHDELFEEDSVTVTTAPVEENPEGVEDAQPNPREHDGRSSEGKRPYKRSAASQ